MLHRAANRRRYTETQMALVLAKIMSPTSPPKNAAIKPGYEPLIRFSTLLLVIKPLDTLSFFTIDRSTYRKVCVLSVAMLRYWSRDVP